MGEIYSMAKSKQTLVYKCVQPEIIKDVANTYKHHKIAQHIEDLYALILYQLQEIHNYRMGTIADVHRNAWKQYDQIILNQENI